MLIKRILDLEDEVIIDVLIELLSTSNSDSFYSKELKDSIKKGLKDYEEGNFRPHSEVVEDLKAKYGLSGSLDS